MQGPETSWPEPARLVYHDEHKADEMTIASGVQEVRGGGLT